ncbi:DUF4430 domain-containing protein [Oscillospiraceae bacterium PP1C4]
MKKWFLSIMLCLTLLFGLAACAGKPEQAAGNEELEIDYLVSEEVEEDPEEEEKSDSLMGWLKQKLSGDKKNAASKPAEEALQDDTSEDSTEASDGIKQWYRQQKKDIPQTASSQDAASNTQSDQPQKRQKTSGSSSSQGAESSKPDGNQPSSAPEPETKKNTVTMHIRCDTAVANGMHLESKWAGIVPASGIIVPTTTYEINDGDTAFDVLCQARDKYKLHMQYEGSKSSIYIQGINNLYEFDGGRWSGWMYSVNGWYPNYGCGVYVLRPGDKIEWNYTCDLGLDLDADMPGAEDWKNTHE